ncbi:MAG: hypothetical protein OXI24_02650 [Candidatus Poribacteria bacterium]|nr:hypothetical protein [Candidatus Poribacteria bacterium]
MFFGFHQRYTVAGILLLGVCFLSCNRITPLSPVSGDVQLLPLSPKLSETLFGTWKIVEIAGVDVSESLSKVQTLAERHVEKPSLTPEGDLTPEAEWFVSYFGDVKGTKVEAVECVEKVLTLTPEGEWSLSLGYNIRLNIRAFHAVRNFADVGVILSVNGSYLAGVDSISNEMLIIFETKAHATEFIHESVIDLGCQGPEACPSVSYLPFYTSALDWSLFDAARKPLSHLFSSPLFASDHQAPVMYTWNIAILEPVRASYSLWLSSLRKIEDLTLTRVDEFR